MANIENTIKKFYKKITIDNNHRYKSWEHCYRHFLKEKDEIKKDMEKSCLHLGFYLASWGMYRGSSFLLQKDYLVHKEVVENIIKYKDLQNLNPDRLLNKTDRIFELMGKIKEIYKEQIKDTKYKGVSDTLATKILLGTLGCTPAYDRFFVKGIRKEKISYSNFDSKEKFKKHFEKLVKFYENNKKEFDHAKKEINKITDIEYPTMKIIDIYFWIIGQ